MTSLLRLGPASGPASGPAFAPAPALALAPSPEAYPFAPFPWDLVDINGMTASGASLIHDPCAPTAGKPYTGPHPHPTHPHDAQPRGTEQLGTAAPVVDNMDPHTPPAPAPAPALAPKPTSA